MNQSPLKTIFARPVMIILIVVLTLTLSASMVSWKAAAQETMVTWRDEFDTNLLDSWYWVNENPAMWNLTEQIGYLRIYASPYGTGGENLLLRPVASGDFVIKTHLLFEPDTDFQFAGLVIYQDETNFLQFGRAFCDVEVYCIGNGIYFDNILGGTNVDGNFTTPVDSLNEAYLRLERRGEMVKAFYSYEGITWFEIGTHWIPPEFQVNAVGLTASQDFYPSDLEVPADFDFFELTEGWGFLPEGFHDYDSGDVPSWACNAGGWAVDPDDREADLSVEIGVDGNLLPEWVLASEYRQDLEEAGLCVGGSCGFNAALWGQITSYEAHSIAVFAQDIPSGEWVLLSSSPKALTCRTYDIYAYDPTMGETRQITDLQDADEYNPSWAPNGRRVAHDVVIGDSLAGIYITDIKSGNSMPLAGAENGNDAVWAPSGRWIVFDREGSLYRLPPAGGTATLVREDAVSADWGPNGRRLVFQQPSDGSIRSIPLFGGPGSETLIASSGANPSWSPDGNWIAYEFNGDIWKVPVNVLGVVLGEPVQVTSLTAGEGQPTWSADSQSIIFHSGFSQDYDLWTVPAAGGDPTWLTGAPGFGDYDPEAAINSASIAYASFSPEGQASRIWVAAFTHDLPGGFWSEGLHTYQFWTGGAPASEERSMDVSLGYHLYEGTVLLRPWSIIARTNGECSEIGGINPLQRTQFFVGWTADGSYLDALAQYDSLIAQVNWDGEAPVDLERHEIFPFTGPVDWFGYACTFTALQPRILVQVTDDWFEAQRFLPNTELTYQILDSMGGSLLASGTIGSDDWGFAGIWVGDVVDLVPGQYIVVSDGNNSKDIVLEAITFDVFNASTGHVEGTAPEPFGRPIWIGIGFPDGGWEKWASTDAAGFWMAEFDQPVPANLEWVAAQAFDADGDISEVRPALIIGP